MAQKNKKSSHTIEKNYQVEHYDSKQEWYQHRGLGGSSVSAILGMNPYQTSLDLYESIINPKEKSVDENETANTIYGKNLEPLIRKMFALDYEGIYKVHTPTRNEMYRRIDKSYLTASLDGVLTEVATGRKGILEIKTHDVRNREDLENWEGGLPQNYFIQLLHYFSVMTDFKFAILCAKLRYFKFDDEEGRKLDKQEVRYYYIERSDVEEQIKYLEKKVTDFWEINVKSHKMPKITVKL